jgi:hypothetical protein
MTGKNPVKPLLICIAVVLLFAACSSSGGGGTAPSSVSLRPESKTVVVGEAVVYTVQIKNVEDAYYAAFDVSYDPDVVVYESADEGVFLNENGSETTLFAVALENATPGRLVVGLSRLGDGEGASGSESLVTLRFRAVAPGTSSVTLTPPRGLLNSENEDISIESWVGAELTVE